jgi:hypothetical protein
MQQAASRADCSANSLKFGFFGEENRAKGGSFKIIYLGETIFFKNNCLQVVERVVN